MAYLASDRTNGGLLFRDMTTDLNAPAAGLTVVYSKAGALLSRHSNGDVVRMSPGATSSNSAEFTTQSVAAGGAEITDCRGTLAAGAYHVQGYVKVANSGTASVEFFLHSTEGDVSLGEVKQHAAVAGQVTAMSVNAYVVLAASATVSLKLRVGNAAQTLTVLANGGIFRATQVKPV